MNITTTTTIHAYYITINKFFDSIDTTPTTTPTPTVSP